MGNPPFEDVSPIKNGGFPACSNNFNEDPSKIPNVLGQHLSEVNSPQHSVISGEAATTSLAIFWGGSGWKRWVEVELYLTISGNLSS